MIILAALATTHLSLERAFGCMNQTDRETLGLGTDSTLIDSLIR